MQGPVLRHHEIKVRSWPKTCRQMKLRVAAAGFNRSPATNTFQYIRPSGAFDYKRVGFTARLNKQVSSGSTVDIMPGVRKSTESKECNSVSTLKLSQHQTQLTKSRKASEVSSQGRRRRPRPRHRLRHQARSHRRQRPRPRPRQLLHQLLEGLPHHMSLQRPTPKVPDPYLLRLFESTRPHS